MVHVPTNPDAAGVPFACRLSEPIALHHFASSGRCDSYPSYPAVSGAVIRLTQSHDEQVGCALGPGCAKCSRIVASLYRAWVTRSQQKGALNSPAPRRLLNEKKIKKWKWIHSTLPYKHPTKSLSNFTIGSFKTSSLRRLRSHKGQKDRIRQVLSDDWPSRRARFQCRILPFFKGKNPHQNDQNWEIRLLGCSNDKNDDKKTGAKITSLPHEIGHY